MISRLLIATTLLVALTGPAVRPAAAQAETQPSVAVDPEFAELRSRFEALHRSLQNNRGISTSDQPAVERFRDEVVAFRAANPDHLGATALALVLAQWLEDTESVSSLYGQLSSLRPDDSGLALAWIAYRERAEELDDDTLFQAYSDLARRFPDNLEIIEKQATMLKERMAYDEIIRLVEPLSPDAIENAQLAYTLADAYFASHRFDDAAAIADQLDTGSIRDPRLRQEVTRNVPVFKAYVDLWTAEQEIRAAEAAADDLPRIEITTAKGRVLIELFENEHPNSVANFIKLSEDGFYTGTRFHRFIKDFMVQGGDPNSRENAEGTAGLGDPGYKLPDEHTGENPRKHFSDSVAMANTGQPNTGGCQFYFNHRPTEWLNGRHTVFGRVVNGRDVVLELREDDEILSVVVVRKRDHPYEPDTIPSGT